MPPKDVERMANSVDPDLLFKSSLIRIYTVCSDIHVPIFKIFTVDFFFFFCGEGGWGEEAKLPSYN